MRRRKGLSLLAVVLVPTSIALAVAACSPATPAVGPNGGDVVDVPTTDVKAEVIGNSDSGEVLVQTWDDELAAPEPLAAESLVLGEKNRQVELMPYPAATDPEGTSSRFYGRAEWLRGARMEEAWIECCGRQAERGGFGWQHGWEAGRRHGEMWQELRGHHERMRGQGHRPGTHRAAEPGSSQPTSPTESDEGNGEQDGTP